MRGSAADAGKTRARRVEWMRQSSSAATRTHRYVHTPLKEKAWGQHEITVRIFASAKAVCMF